MSRARPGTCLMTPLPYRLRGRSGLARAPDDPHRLERLRLRNFRRYVFDLAADDVGADLIDLLDLRLGDLRGDLADADPVVLQSEDDVAALELAVDDELDRVVDGGVDALDRAGEDVRPEERLVGVDADPPDALLLRRVERAQAAAAGHLEDHARALLNLIEGNLLALGLVGEVLRVAVERLDAGICGLRARLVARDETVDRRLRLAADRP